MRWKIDPDKREALTFLLTTFEDKEIGGQRIRYQGAVQQISEIETTDSFICGLNFKFMTFKSIMGGSSQRHWVPKRGCYFRKNRDGIDFRLQ